jgi:RNA polymerase sporulation-specific sigma factor
MSVQEGSLLSAARSGDPSASEQLLSENEKLVWAVVHRYTGRGVEPEDLFQLGCIGFLKSLRGFDPGYGTRFSTYAVPKIAGEIRRFLRDDGAVKVSRSLRERAARVHAQREQLRWELGREPRLSELSERLGLEAEEIAAADSAGAEVASLQEENAEGLTLESTLGDEGMEEGLLERLALREAIDSLPERERKVILLRYYRSLTQQKVASIVGVSQVQVSRIEKKALARMKSFLQECS